MEKKTVLIVGKSFSELTNYLREHEYEYVILRDIQTVKNPEAKLKRRVLCDFSSTETITQAIGNVSGLYNIDAVLTIYEQYILAAAVIAEHLGLPAIPVKAARACTDKFLMRQLFADAPQKISPDFAVVKTEQDVRDFANAHSFPLILKPANLSKSLLVFKNDNLQDLLANYHKMMAAIDGVYARYAPHNTPKVLIEEFMSGPVHSVDAFVDNDSIPHVLEQVVDYQTGYDIGYDDNFHYSRIIPSALSTEEILRIREVAALGCKALGMRSSPAHVEIIRTDDGPMIVEIGARNGGYRQRMHGLANGIDLTDNALRLAFGDKPQLKTERSDAMGVFELFPKFPGAFHGIAKQDELKQLASLVYFSQKVELGDHVGLSSEGHKMCAVVMLHNEDHEQFARDLAWFNQNVCVLTT